MKPTPEERARLLAMLEDCKWLMQRTTGGVDQHTSYAAAQMITRLRNLVRDDEALHAHWAAIVAEPPRAKRRRKGPKVT